MSVFAAIEAEIVLEASLLLSWSERLESSGEARVEFHRGWPVVADSEAGPRWSAYSDSISGQALSCFGEESSASLVLHLSIVLS